MKKGEEMKEIILGFPEQFKVGLEGGKKVSLKKKKYKRVVVCGMGGSGLPGEILGCLFGYLEAVSSRISPIVFSIIASPFQTRVINFL